jgi:hypothetical protein
VSGGKVRRLSSHAPLPLGIRAVFGRSFAAHWGLVAATLALFVAAFVVASPAFANPIYDIVDLGTLGGFGSERGLPELHGKRIGASKRTAAALLKPSPPSSLSFR